MKRKRKNDFVNHLIIIFYLFKKFPIYLKIKAFCNVSRGFFTVIYVGQKFKNPSIERVQMFLEFRRDVCLVRKKYGDQRRIKFDVEFCKRRKSWDIC